MSTDLQIRLEMPKVRISPIKIAVLPSDDASSAHGSVPIIVQNKLPEQEDDESCRTPTSKESRIPEILTCPPAPRKPKRAVSCKRKLLDEFQFFDVANKEEIDSFFRSTFPKRSCRCT